MGAGKHEFARILERILERDVPPQASKAPDSPYESQPPFTFNWFNISSPKSPRGQRMYPHRPRRPRFTASPPKREFTLKTQDLTNEERAAAALLFKSARLPEPEELSESAVKKAFRCVAKALHPDSRIGLDKNDQPELSLLFAQANRAYRLLIKALRGRGHAAGPEANLKACGT